MQSRGTYKIFDGFYIGDEYSAEDQDHILLNHVSLIVNLSNNIPNHYQHHSIHYLNVSFISQTEKHSWQQIFRQVAEAKEEGESVLIHDQSNLDIPAAIALVYIMEKFQWSLFKTLEFLSLRIKNLTFRPQTFQLLKNYELQLLNECNKLSYNWSQKPKDQEQLVLRNTYLNCNDKEKKNMVSKPKEIENRKDEKRVSWDFSVKNEAPMIKQGYKKAQKVQSDTNGLKNQIILNVRRILNDYKKGQHLDKYKIVDSSRRVNVSNRKSPSLKKHKSSYFIPSIQSFQKSSMALTNRSQKPAQILLSQEKPSADISLLSRDRNKTLPAEEHYLEQINTENSVLTTQNQQRFIQNIISQSNCHISLLQNNNSKKSSSLRTLNYRSSSKKKLNNNQNDEKYAFVKLKSNKLLPNRIR